MAQIRDAIDKSLKRDRQSVIITPAIIKQCILRLKSGKDDGDLGFKSDHLINGNHRLHVVLSLLFNVMINHGYTPDVLLKSTIVSIPKDPKLSLSNSDNYRGISLFNCICKLFDNVILLLYKSQLSPSEMQFGFKEKHSTCCCLPTPMALASGGSPMFPLVVHQPASPSIWPAVQSLRRGLSTNPGATMWCVCGCS